mgnify:CR=1 FL=1
MAELRVKDATSDRVLLMEESGSRVFDFMVNLSWGGGMTIAAILFLLLKEGRTSGDLFWGSVVVFFGVWILYVGLYRLTKKRSIEVERTAETYRRTNSLKGYLIPETKIINFEEVEAIELTYRPAKGGFGDHQSWTVNLNLLNKLQVKVDKYAEEIEAESVRIALANVMDKPVTWSEK